MMGLSRRAILRVAATPAFLRVEIGMRRLRPKTEAARRRVLAPRPVITSGRRRPVQKKQSIEGYEKILVPESQRSIIRSRHGPLNSNPNKSQIMKRTCQ